MNEPIRTVINQIKDEFHQNFPNFQGIYLYGSRARGDEHEDSDYDIVVVFDGKVDWRLKKTIRKMILNYELVHNIIIDSSIYNSEDLIQPATPFREEVLKDGIYYAV